MWRRELGCVIMCKILEDGHGTQRHAQQMMAKQVREIRWQRVEMSQHAQAEWLVSAMLEEAGSDDTASRRGRKGRGIES